ncbi:MAG: hypothetical protein ABIT08_15345 [Bacteroidia bacterium]
MKNVPALVAAMALFLNTNVYCQKEITITPVNKQISRGMQPGYTVNIPEAKLKDIHQAMKKYLEDNTRARIKESDGETVIYGAVNKNFSSKPFIIYSKLYETNEGVEFTAFVTEDSLTFIDENSEAEKVKALKKSLHEFAADQYRKIVTVTLNVEKDKLNVLKKTLNKQVTAENDNVGDISKNQREIESSNAKRDENKVQQASKLEQLMHQEKTFDEISDKKSPEHDLAAKNLKKFKGDKKDLEKEAEKLGNNIDENNADIKLLENKNEELKKQQEDSKKKVEDQEAVVKKVEDILNGIK